MESENINVGVPWPATDALGRELPLESDVGAPRRDKFVGIFYFLWMGQHDKGSDKVYDVAKILAEDPDALSKGDSPLWGPHGHMHFWGESLYGYYRSEDPWVIRRHGYLLADAGVDTLIFDTTNRATYRDVYMTLCEVFSEIRAEGGSTPQITFMCNTRAGDTAQELFDDLYDAGKYKDLWFQWEGKPFLICDPNEVSDEIREFFTLRKAHWPFEQVNTKNAWHWEAAYPQVYGFTDDPNVPEQVNVSVAQNLRVSDGKVTNMSDGNARGRSFHNGAKDESPGAVNHGHNAAEQWERVHKLNPPFVMVTGWNEWIAGRWQRGDDKNVFVDQFDQEYSRDIEMVKGLHGDNYYYQLINNVRRYKGCPPLPKASPPKSIDLAESFDPWDTVAPSYQDHAGETRPRDHKGVGPNHYTNTTGRNEFLLAKVARDDTHVHFYMQTKDAITSWQDPNWMMLLIRVNGSDQPDWESFQFIINRTITDATTTTLECSTGGWNWNAVAEVAYRVEGNQMHLSIPRDALGIGDTFSIDFKWIDNPTMPGDIMDTYVSGDAAPAGRFRYRYIAE